MRAFIYGLFSYFFLYFIVFLFNLGIECIIKNFAISKSNIDISKIKLTFLDALQNSEITINYMETVISAIIAILLSFKKSNAYNIISSYNHLVEDKMKKDTFFSRAVLKIYKYLENKKIISKGNGNDDVWNYTFAYLNNWITVSDYENNIVYNGLLTSCSTTNHVVGELFLENVEVYELRTNKKIRDVKAVYLSQKADIPWNIEIDFK